MYSVPLVLRMGLAKPAESIGKRKADIALYRRLRPEALRIAANRNFDFVFMHRLLPHYPFIYDRFRGNFSLSGESDYLDNLALTGSDLRDIRKAMRSAGSWDLTAVLVISDHWHRPATFYAKNRDQRIPFILHLPGQKKPLVYEKPFNTIIFRGLARSLVRGDLSTTREVTSWIAHHTPTAKTTSPRSFQDLVPHIPSHGRLSYFLK